MCRYAYTLTEVGVESLNVGGRNDTLRLHGSMPLHCAAHAAPSVYTDAAGAAMSCTSLHS
jgi:hypothetical protein